jgi:FixJ family two-component response regulator
MIYIIEDDESVRRACELFLKLNGMESMPFESATDFIFKVKPGNQDTLILDLNFPGMSGCDLLKKYIQDGIHTRIIVVTAFDDPESLEICSQYGVKAYLRKPVDGQALIDIIKYNMPHKS